jgi:hypothetical protein
MLLKCGRVPFSFALVDILRTQSSWTTLTTSSVSNILLHSVPVKVWATQLLLAHVYLQCHQKITWFKLKLINLLPKTKKKKNYKKNPPKTPRFTSTTWATQSVAYHLAYKIDPVTLTFDQWPSKSIGFQILLRTKYVPSEVKIH